MRNLSLVFLAALSAVVFADRSNELFLPLEPAQIETFLAANPQIQSVESFLSKLPAGITRHAVFLAESQSLQTASSAHPRALLFDELGRNVLAFNGEEKQKKFSAIEMFHFDESTRSFDFREIQFGASGGKISERNPAVCITCHGKDPRPIWAPYPFWTGAYEARRHTSDSAEVKEGQKVFWKNHSKHPRYGVVDASIQNDVSIKNVQFTHVLFERNSERIGKIISKTPFYSAYRFALVEILLCHESGEKSVSEVLSELMPKSLADEHVRALKENEEIDGEKTNFRYLHALFDARGVSTKSWATHLGPNDREALSRFGVTNAENFPSASLLAYKGLSFDDELGLSKLRVEDRNISGFPRPFKHYSNPDVEFCGETRRKSRAAFDELLKVESPKSIFERSKQSNPPRTALEVLGQCAICHDGTVGPKIPFADINLLRNKLKLEPKLLNRIFERVSSKDEKKVMPPNNPLLESEQQNVMELMKNLAD